MKKESGITLVALVITIVVLLILAGITIMYVMGDNSVFKQASNAKEQTERAKAREKLELLFSSLQIEKYEKALTKEVLSERITEEINKIGGEEIGYDKSQVIVDGYIFRVDRSVPKIIEELGTANEIIITAVISGNNGWLKEGESATVTGTIKTYSGGNITNVSATKDGTEISDFSIDEEGRYEITGITSDTTIEIKAKDSNNKKNSKTIPITVRIDGTAPTAELSTEWLEENGNNRLKISINNVNDEVSGINNSKTKLYIIPENGTKQEKKISLTNGEGSIIVDGLNMESCTKIELIIQDNAGNKIEKQKSTGRSYMVKDGKISKGTPWVTNDASSITVSSEDGVCWIQCSAYGDNYEFAGFELTWKGGKGYCQVEWSSSEGSGNQWSSWFAGGSSDPETSTNPQGLAPWQLLGVSTAGNYPPAEGRGGKEFSCEAGPLFVGLIRGGGIGCYYTTRLGIRNMFVDYL